MKKLTALLLALVMVFGMVACGEKTPAETNAPETQAPETQPTEPAIDIAEEAYTYHSYSTSLGNNWNPHSWETSGDDAIQAYLSAPLATMQVQDSENGIYQWIFVAATSVTDVTADHKDDLTKYAVTLPEGQTAEATEKGYVFEIALNPDMKWQDGTPINADTYIYSMQQLLNPEMRNYRANLYYDGESAVAGGNKYYNSGAPIYNAMVPAYGEGETPDYSYDLDAGIAAGEVYLNVNSGTTFTSSYTIAGLDSSYLGGAHAATLEALAAAENAFGYAPVTAENAEAVKAMLGDCMSLFGLDPTDYTTMKEWFFVNKGEIAEVYDYDSTVGCYKVDDYTIRYVTQAQIDYNYFLTSCTSNWLVYEELYEAGKDTTGTLVTTDYCTSMETTMSYGPYKIESLQADKQIVFVQNENWYNYQKDENGNLFAVTDYLVDGENVTQYQTNKVVIDVMTDEAAKQAFLKGELTEWAPPADEVANYATSSQMYKVDETYTMSFFFNTNVVDLQAMDASKGNTNSVVLSNTNFRKAFSLAIDRADWVTATAGYKPAYALMNTLYFYDVYNDPTSSYRGSDEAMQAVCDLYGVEYGDGKAYATLKEAYDSINGYNLTEAKALMATACTELVEAGLYTAGEDIVIRIGYKKGALDSADQNQIAKMNQYINAAAEGSGFGKITLEGIDNIQDRYGDVGKGEFAIGYGAWGGAAFYPFRNMQVYCDTEQYDVNEIACWNPAVEELTINIEGEDVTMTWQDWSRALVGTGPYAGADAKVKLAVTATMEKEFLSKYYRIPLAGSCVASLLSYQVAYYTEDYNIMYGFGGMELMTYNYSDAEWVDYVASQGGELSYE